MLPLKLRNFATAGWQLADRWAVSIERRSRVVWKCSISVEDVRSVMQPTVTLVDLRDQSFSGTSAAFSFNSTGAGTSSAGAAAGLRDAGASSAGALSVKASIKVVFLAFDFRVGRRHADFHLRPLRKTLPMGPR